MSLTQHIRSAKPYVWGGVIGIVATLIVEFSAGWVVTTDTMREKVAAAETRVLASVCANEGRTYWTSQGRQMQALDGWDNEKRASIADRFTPEVEKVPLNRVTQRCGDKLNPGAF